MTTNLVLALFLPDFWVILVPWQHRVFEDKLKEEAGCRSFLCSHIGVYFQILIQTQAPN